MINTMTKRILGALIISFAAAQAAQACDTCDLHSKKETKAHEHKPEAAAAEEGQAEEAVQAKAGKAKRTTLTGTFEQTKKGVHFVTSDGKIYKMMNQKHVKDLTEQIDKPVKIIALVVTSKDKKRQRLGKIIKVTPVKVVANQEEAE